MLTQAGKGFGKHDPRRAYRGCRNQGDEPHSLREHRFQHHRGPGAPARTGRAIEGGRPGRTTSRRCETCRFAGARTGSACRSTPARHNRCGRRLPQGGHHRDSNHGSATACRRRPSTENRSRRGAADARRERRTQGQGREGCFPPRSSRRRRRGRAPVLPKAGKCERHRRRDRRRPGCAGGEDPDRGSDSGCGQDGPGTRRRAIHSAASARRRPRASKRRAQLQRGDRGGAPRASKGTRPSDIGGGYRSARQPPGAGGKEKRGAPSRASRARGASRVRRRAPTKPASASSGRRSASWRGERMASRGHRHPTAIPVLC